MVVPTSKLVEKRKVATVTNPRWYVAAGSYFDDFEVTPGNINLLYYHTLSTFEHPGSLVSLCYYLFVQY